tara:strand:+ start:4525 stop:4944 length:420 start_codon:yes stop_codon:yes gene_type:complete
MDERAIAKELSANDAGETGGHQAGILVPKEPDLLSFFPRLDASQYNPRAHIIFTDEAGGQWEFAFIYYNNALFGKTRNEYRLTRMTKYIRQSGLVSGDHIEMKKSADGNYYINFRRKNSLEYTEGKALRLSSGWRVIDI